MSCRLAGTTGEASWQAVRAESRVVSGEPPVELGGGAAVGKAGSDVVGYLFDRVGGIADGYPAPGPLQHFNVVVAVTNG